MENPLDTLPDSNQAFSELDNHNHDGLNSPLIDPVNLPSGGGLTLIKYIETPATSINFNNLDPNVNGYQLIVQFDSGSFQDNMRLRFNNDDTASIYYESYEFEQGSVNGSGAFDYLPLSSIQCNAAQICLTITKPSALNYLISGIGAVAGWQTARRSERKL